MRLEGFERSGMRLKGLERSGMRLERPGMKGRGGLLSLGPPRSKGLLPTQELLTRGCFHLQSFNFLSWWLCLDFREAKKINQNYHHFLKTIMHRIHTYKGCQIFLARSVKIREEGEK